MLFDLRSRGRRRTVQAVYLGLAVLMGGGLILFGVGTGSGIGGLLNAFTGSGSNQQSSIISSQQKAAIKQTKESPNSPQSWADLVTADYEAAGNGYDSSTQTYTAEGKRQLAAVTSAWKHYSSLTKSPSTNIIILAANAYGALGQYSPEASTWDQETLADPTDVKGFECLAISAYAAKQTREGDLAADKAGTMVPKATRKTLLSEIDAAKTQPTLAQSC